MKQQILTHRMLMLIVLCAMGMDCFCQTFVLKGRVTDDNGDALELATVSCMEQAKVTMTSLKGEFQLTLQTADSVVVKFSMVPEPYTCAAVTLSSTIPTSACS